MARQLEEIRLTFITERVRFNNGTLSDGPTTAIIECHEQGNQDSVIVKVESLPIDFAPHLDYLFYGSWDNHPKYGKQFAAKTFVKVRPLGRRGVIHYLMQAPHVGNITAGKLWRLYGDDAIEMLRKSPDECSLAIGGAFTV